MALTRLLCDPRRQKKNLVRLAIQIVLYSPHKHCCRTILCSKGMNIATEHLEFSHARLAA
jgi:hypothetical protein